MCDFMVGVKVVLLVLVNICFLSMERGMIFDMVVLGCKVVIGWCVVGSIILVLSFIVCGFVEEGGLM